MTKSQLAKNLNVTTHTLKNKENIMNTEQESKETIIIPKGAEIWLDVEATTSENYQDVYSQEYKNQFIESILIARKITKQGAIDAYTAQIECFKQKQYVGHRSAYLDVMGKEKIC